MSSELFPSRAGWSASRVLARLLLVLLLAAPGGCRVFVLTFGGPNQLSEAEEFTRQARYDEAIERYRAHMRYRLAASNRPEWENPYFYLLLIGDLQVRKGEPEAALDSYAEAEAHGVDLPLVSDRYRSLAHWYEQQGRLQDASDLLLKYRDKDPLLMEAMLDRISKEIVRREDAAGFAVAKPSPTPGR